MNNLFNSKKLLACSFFFLISCNLLGQTSKFGLKLATKHLSTANGLSDSHINSSFIDSKGRIWFLTNNKISHFKADYVRNIEFTPSYSNKGFNNLVEDALGNFWLSENFEWFYPFNIQRCVVYNPNTKITLPVDQYLNKKLNIHSVVSDNEGIIYLSTKTGEIYKFEPTNKQLTPLASLAKTPVKILYADKTELIACIEKTSKFDSQIAQIQPDGKLIRRQDVIGKFVKSIIKLHNKTYFTFEQDQLIGLAELGGKSGKSFKVSKDSYLGGITFNTEKKLFVLNKGTGLDFFNENLELIKSENYDFLIHQVNHDSTGNSFLATNNGVYILRLVEQRIKTYLENPDPEKANDNYSCRAILKLKDYQLIVNTNRRRQLIDLKSGKTRTLAHSFHHSHSDNKFILSALKDKDGELLFGEDMLMKTDINSGQNTVFCTLDSTKIWSMASYRNGLLLGLEKKGIIFYDKHNKTAKKYTINNKNLKNSIIYDFYVIKDNSVLIASEAGLFLLRDNSDFQAIKLPVADNVQVSFFSIGKQKNKPDELLMASSRGIWVYNLVSQTVSPFIQDLSFQKKKFLSAYKTNNGVWSSSEEGVWHFNDQGVLLKIFTETDGLSSKECNRLAHYHDENDLLYFGGVNGLNIINPQDFSDQKEAVFSITIKEIWAYRNQVKSRKMPTITGGSIQLERAENRLTIDLDYEDFKYDCTKKYFYRSSHALTKDWIPIVGRTLVLNYIDRGKTDIEIRVVSCDNYTEVQTLHFSINRPPQIYLEWYFIPTLVLILGVLFWIFNKYTTYQLRLRNESLQRKIDLQTRTLKDSLMLKETLLSLLVHDVRYPVQSFYDLSKKLAYLTRKNDQERLLLLGKETEEKSRKVLWLIDELVYWVKSTNDKNDIVLQEKNLGDQILQILDIYDTELKKKNLQVATRDTSCLIVADYGLLIIVLRNLIYNAVVYSKPFSIIDISLKHTDEKNILKIVNQSMGNSRTLGNSLGIGLELLLPMLEKSGMKLKTELLGEKFTATLELENRVADQDD